MKTISQSLEQNADDQKTIYIPKPKIKNKKIYFDADGTEVKIGYDDTIGVGFVEIITS
jgi:hypothetical protein